MGNSLVPIALARSDRLLGSALRAMASGRPQLPRVVFAIHCEECGELIGRVETGFSEFGATPIIIEHTHRVHPVDDTVRGD